MSDKQSLHLPTTQKEMRARGWDRLDVVLVTGDAHVDHPSFPAALLGRLLEARGFRVGVISRPEPGNPEAMTVLGQPRLFFGVTAGALDSMVGNLTAQKKRRNDDPFAPGGKAGGRPDRALTAYCNLIRQAYGKRAFVVAGGMEACLRRFAHYDYWSDSVRRPILMDCGADVLVHGMGEGPIVEIVNRLDRAMADSPSLPEPIELLRDVPGLVFREPKSRKAPENGQALPSCEQVKENPRAHVRAFSMMEKNRDELLYQECSGMRVIANPAWPPLSPEQLDELYALPFTRDPHPTISGQRVPALEQVRFSVTSHRGCVGGCAFCAIGVHQGRTISSRSAASILNEIKRIVAHPEFRGTINDIGGPSANMYGLACNSDKTCRRVSCLWPKQCRHLDADQTPYLEVLNAARNTPGVKHLFVTTGVRIDLIVQCEPLVRALALHHTSGQLKVAPEHTHPEVLSLMRKPAAKSFGTFLNLYRRLSEQAGKKQYVLPYMMAAHPGSDAVRMAEVAAFLKNNGLLAEQCQIFTPTPGTASTVMYATGLDPSTLEPVFVEKTPRKKQAQKEMILHHLNASYKKGDQRPSRPRPRGPKKP